MVVRIMTATPNPVDIHVGKQLRLRRTMLGKTQDALARSLDLSFQQIQKYERGTNRIGSSRLYQFSQILDVPIAFFFDGVPKVGASPEQPQSTDPQSKRETLELVRAFTRISDPLVRKHLLRVAKVMAEKSPLD